MIESACAKKVFCNALATCASLFRNAAACAKVISRKQKTGETPGYLRALRMTRRNARFCVRLLRRQRLHARSETRHFARSGVLVNDALLRGAHHFRRSALQRGGGDGGVAGRDRLFHLRTKVRMRLRRCRLTAVRRAILRTAFLAELVLAISLQSFRALSRGGAPRKKQRGRVNAATEAAL